MEIKKAIILGPSHYVGFEGVRVLSKNKTPMGEFDIIPNDFEEIEYDHSIDNQIPFLQKLNFEIEILPLVVGEITSDDAKKLAEKLLKIDSKVIISTDLSHFLTYDEAVKKDKASIKIIEDLDINKLEDVDACGKFPLMVLIWMCKLKGWKPKLIEYKNSGDITGDKSSVVGYSTFVF